MRKPVAQEGGTDSWVSSPGAIKLISQRENADLPKSGLFLAIIAGSGHQVPVNHGLHQHGLTQWEHKAGVRDTCEWH